jgi:hypothetical protein
MKLIVQSLEDKKILGKVGQDDNGRFFVESDNGKTKQEIFEIVEKIAAENPELTYKSGREEKAEGLVSRVTIVKKTKRGDPNYLRGLADYIAGKDFRKENKVGGKEIRAYIETES